MTSTPDLIAAIAQAVPEFAGAKEATDVKIPRTSAMIFFSDQSDGICP